ncbi:MAG: redoxin domain-containing protein [Methanomassiliicoccales archaeon]|nr:redoxin domain-containing protein [Methanomassiliicoccales archaeon]
MDKNIAEGLMNSTICLGSQAPEFRVPGVSGSLTALSDLISTGPVLLIFYPADFGWICRGEVMEFQERMADFQGIGVQLVGISTDSVMSHGLWSEQLHISYPLLSDRDGTLSASYGVMDLDLSSFNQGRCKRALFLVDREAIVRFIWITEDQWQNPDADRVLAHCARSLQCSRSTATKDLRIVEGLQRYEVEQFETAP